MLGGFANALHGGKILCLNFCGLPEQPACVEDAPFAFVGAFKDHVNVGFFHGDALPDPAGLLQGADRYMRHVKVKPGKALDESSLEALIDSAYRDIRSRLTVAR